MSSPHNKINACRPGFGASCALCCGSHNCDAGPEEIASLYRRRGEIAGLYSREYLVRAVMSSRSDMTGSYYFAGRKDIGLPELPALFDSPRCPFVGIFKGGDAVCCLLHREAGNGLRYECFNNYSSKNFTCSAKESLGTDEILFAAKLLRDWFYYPLLIQRRDLLVPLMNAFRAPDDVPGPAIERLKEELFVHSRNDAALHGMMSYF